MKWRWQNSLLLVGLALLLGLAFRPDSPPVAAVEDRPAKAAPLPADLAAIPGEGLFLASFRVAELWQSPQGATIRTTVGKELEPALKEIKGVFGIGPEQMERLTIYFADPQRSTEPLVFIGTTKAFETKELIDVAMPRHKTEQSNGRTLYVETARSGSRPKTILVLSERAYVLGNKGDLAAYLERGVGKKGALDSVRTLAAGKHHFTGGFHVAGLARIVGERIPPEIEPFTPLLKGELAVATASLDKGLSGEIKVTFGNEKDAAAGRKSAQMLVDLLQNQLGQVKKALQADLKLKDGALSKIVKDLDAGLQKAAPAQNGTVVSMSLNVPVDAAAFTQATIEATIKVRQAAARMQSANNLKQLGLAMHNYLSAYGSFPPAAIYNKNGKPLLSWRVLILPFVEQEQLYKEFKLDEPWDSEHNKKLLAKMPRVFASPTAPQDAAAFRTHYLGFMGKGAFFEGTRGIPIASITDGTSNTIMLIEGAPSVPWTKPEEIPYDDNKPMPKLLGLYPGGFNAVYCDGSVRFLSDKLKEATLRLMITRADGQVIPNEN